MIDRFPAYVVRKTPIGVSAEVETLSPADLPAGELTIEVAWSSLNYKDALAARAHAGVVRSLPHVPGIDAAGRVLASDSPEYAVGDPVVVTGAALGAEAWGGWSGVIRVPAQWAVPMPAGLDPRAAMVYGTAGFTAAQCVSALVDRGIEPDRGDVVVTGATGGVGVISAAILAKLGYRVVAVTGKADRAADLLALGVAEVLGRDALVSPSENPLLPGRWAAGIDTVGGEPLATMIRQTRHRGVVACCGLVAGESLALTVHPFILRGVTLAGIDSAKCPREPRLRMWRQLAGPWRVDLPADWVQEVDLNGVSSAVDAILAGKNTGRTLVRPQIASKTF